MDKWPAFENAGNVYDLSHLDSCSITTRREAINGHPEKVVRIFLKYADHCFTDHHGPDDSWIYPHTRGRKERYFNTERYEFSFELPRVLHRILNDNLYLKRTFNERREQFFHLDEKTLFCDYRIFLEIKKFKNKSHDIWMNVISAYPEKPFALPVGGDQSFKIWRVMDARIGEVDLPAYGKKRRRR